MHSKIILICILIMIILASCSCIYYYKDYSLFLKLNHEITIQKVSKLVYRAENEGPHFHGDGYYYTVLKYKKRFTKEYLDNYKSGRNISIENAITNILDEIQVPQEKRPNFTKEYYWDRKAVNGNDIYLLYFMEDNSLHIFEDIS